MQGRVKEVVCCLLKGGQHEHAVLHLGNAKAGDAQHLALEEGGKGKMAVLEELGVQ